MTNMLLNKKMIVTLGLASVVAMAGLTSMAPDKPEYKNLKVLPKNLTHQQLGGIMDEWAHSLGVHCTFCHVRDEAAKKMDFASDAKPEKTTARHMYKMMNKINHKFFEAKKDSLGMMARTGVNCNTCHRGSAHPELKLPPREERRPGGPGGPPPGGEKKS